MTNRPRTPANQESLRGWSVAIECCLDFRDLTFGESRCSALRRRSVIGSAPLLCSAASEVRCVSPRDVMELLRPLQSKKIVDKPSQHAKGEVVGPFVAQQALSAVSNMQIPTSREDSYVQADNGVHSVAELGDIPETLHHNFHSTACFRLQAWSSFRKWLIPTSGIRA